MTGKSVRADTDLKVVIEVTMVTGDGTVIGVAQDHQKGASIVNTGGVDRHRLMAIDIGQDFEAESLLWRQSAKVSKAPMLCNLQDGKTSSYRLHAFGQAL